MENKEKTGFQRRFNEVVNEYPFEPPLPAGRGRQAGVHLFLKEHGLIMDKTSVRKWLAGEGFPTIEHGVVLAKIFHVQLDWLMTGRGAKRTMDESNHELVELLDIWFRLPAADREQWKKYGEFLSRNVAPKEKEAPHPHQKLQS